MQIQFTFLSGEIYSRCGSSVYGSLTAVSREIGRESQNPKGNQAAGVAVTRLRIEQKSAASIVVLPYVDDLVILVTSRQQGDGNG